MLKKVLLICFTLAVANSLSFNSPGATEQQPAATFGNNQCVTCHSRISAPATLNSRYLDWHFSAHRASGISCDKCHGGDANARDPKQAHKAVLPSSNKESRLNQANLPETCGACHKAVVNAFVESNHYQRLKSSGLGPSCTTCHGHMASSIATHSDEAASYCAFCHNSKNGILPQKPDIPASAARMMESIGRANYTGRLVAELLKEAQSRNLDVAEQQEDTRLLQGLLLETRVGWHAFARDGVQVKADKAFTEGVNIRDQLMKKLGPELMGFVSAT